MYFVKAVALSLVSLSSISFADPIIQLTKLELTKAGTSYFGRFSFTTTNWSTFGDDLFAPSPNLPPCGRNINSSRSWVNIYNADTNAYIYGFCALGSASNLQNLWFGFTWGATIPKGVYMVIQDRLTNTAYRSNTLPL